MPVGHVYVFFEKVSIQAVCPIFFFNKFIYLFYLFCFWLRWIFVAVPGLSLVAVSGGYSFIVVHRLLIVVASLVAEHRL